MMQILTKCRHCKYAPAMWLRLRQTCFYRDSVIMMRMLG